MAYNTSNTAITNEGSFRISDTSAHTGIYYSIIPEVATTVTTLTIIKSDGTTIDAKTTRNLASLTAGIPIFPGGDGSYFSVITLASGSVIANK